MSQSPSRANRSKGRLASLALLGMAIFAGYGCQRSEPEPNQPAAPAVAQDQSSAAAGVVKALSPLGRADILDAMSAAADAAAAGAAPPPPNADLVNRSFELHLPIGCSGGAIGSWGTWTINRSTNVLRVSFHRQSWDADSLFAQIAGGLTYDAAEGFWIERPWTQSEQCPPDPASNPASATPPTAQPQEATADEPQPQALPTNTVALVQYFSPESPRTLRRGDRPYTFTVKLPADAVATPRTFRIKVSGRIDAFADRQPVHCVVSDAARPPVCGIAVEFGEIVLEDAVTGERLAGWTS